jgi:hypothetical protein
VPPNAGELAGYRSIWDAPEVEFSPSLEFLFPDKARLARDKRQPEQERLQDVALEAAAGLNALRR